MNNNFFKLNLTNKQITLIENILDENPTRQSLHRSYLRLSRVNRNKSNYYIERAISIVIKDISLSSKSYLETQYFLIRYFHWLYFIKLWSFSTFTYISTIELFSKNAEIKN